MALRIIDPAGVAETHQATIPADGVQSLVITIEVTDDASRTPVPDGTPIYADDGADGQYCGAPLDDVPGRMTYFTVNGTIAIRIFPSLQPAEFTLRVWSENYGTLSIACTIEEPAIRAIVRFPEEPQWYDGVATAAVSCVLTSTYEDSNGNPPDVSGINVLFEWIDPNGVPQSQTVPTTADGVASITLGPITQAHTFVVHISAEHTWTAGYRTIHDVIQEIAVVPFTRSPVVEVELVPANPPDTPPLKVWADGTDSQEFTIRLSWDYPDNNAYFESAQFDNDNPDGVTIDLSYVDSNQTAVAGVVSPDSVTLTSSNAADTVTLGPHDEAVAGGQLRTSAPTLTVTFGNTTISTQATASNYNADFVEPTFTLTIHAAVHERGDDLPDDLFKDSTRKLDDYGEYRCFADGTAYHDLVITLQCDYPDADLSGHTITMHCKRGTVHTWDPRVEEDFDPNVDDVGFLELDDFAGIAPGSVEESQTTASDGTAEFSTVALQPDGYQDQYLRLTTAASGIMTFGTRTVDVDPEPLTLWLSYYPPLPRIDITVQVHNDDPEDTFNKLPADHSRITVSAQREGTTDESGEDDDNGTTLRRPGVFIVTTANCWNESQALPIYISSNQMRTTIQVTGPSYTERVARYLMDGPFADSLVIYAWTVSNGLMRQTSATVPYYADDPHFYHYDLFLPTVTRILDHSLQYEEADLTSQLPADWGSTPLLMAVARIAIDEIKWITVPPARISPRPLSAVVVLSDGLNAGTDDDADGQAVADKVNAIAGRHRTPLLLCAPQSAPVDAETWQAIRNTEGQILEDPDFGAIREAWRDAAQPLVVDQVIDLGDEVDVSAVYLTVHLADSREYTAYVRIGQASDPNDGDAWSNTYGPYVLSEGNNEIELSPTVRGRYAHLRIMVEP